MDSSIAYSDSGSTSIGKPNPYNQKYRNYLNKINKGLTLDQQITELNLIDVEIHQVKNMALNWVPNNSTD